MKRNASLVLTTTAIFTALVITFLACNKQTEVSPNASNGGSSGQTKTTYTGEIPDYVITFNNGVKAKYWIIQQNGTWDVSWELKTYNSNNALIDEYVVASSYVAGTNDVTMEFKMAGVPIAINTFKPNSYPGDCSKLGSRKQGESYDDCFGRNWSNFCCDFTGCAAQTLSPVTVAAAIGISCAFKERPAYPATTIESMYITDITVNGSSVYARP